jgi:hypothetical protein
MQQTDLIFPDPLLSSLIEIKFNRDDKNKLNLTKVLQKLLLDYPIFKVI